jgi:outer membrane murein-binding lipoprotein Lpp
MKKFKLLFYVIAISLAISGCGQQEIDRLKSENVALKSKMDALEQENTKLKETDQAYFNRGIDAMKNANTKSSLQSSLDAFTQLTEKFPESSYSAKAQQYVADIREKLTNIDRAETAKVKFEGALNAHKFTEASSALQSLSVLISEDEYKTLASRLYNEKNKPLETTVNKLVSQFGSYKDRLEPQNAFGMLDKRVKIEVTFTMIDRDRKELHAYSDGWAKGSPISVFYEGTNMADYFTDNDPECCDNRYIVVGVTKMYSDSDQLYIKAEKIDQLQQ